MWSAVDNGGPVTIWDSKAGSSQLEKGGRWGQIVIDARTIGLMPEQSMLELDSIIPNELRGVIDADMRVEDDGAGIITVKAETRSSTIIWWLDSNKNYNPVKIERLDDNGDLLSSTRTELAYHDEYVWFPSRVECKRL